MVKGRLDVLNGADAERLSHSEAGRPVGNRSIQLLVTHRVIKRRV